MTASNIQLRAVFPAILLLLLGCVLPASAQNETGQPYVVQRDDTLWKLAGKYLGDGNRYHEIIAATQSKNRTDASFAALFNPNIIRAGDKIWIPAGENPPDSPLESGAVEFESSTPAATNSVQQATALPNAAATGKIAFSFWNNAPERCTYEINIIDVSACLSGPATCQANRRILSLNNASEPALSPDGQRLAFRGWGAIAEKFNNDQQNHPYYGCPGPFAERQLGHTTLDGSDYFRMGGFWEDSHPDWSPDGNRLLFDTGRNGDGITRVMSISADGMREETLRLAGQQPSWAPDNERFVYRGCDLSGNRCGLWQAKVLPVEAWDLGVNLIGPVLLNETQAAHPDWSPVEDVIVFQSPASGNWDLYLINADGTNRRQLTTDPGIEGLPAWSPDGQWIAYLADKGGNWGVWITRPDGSERHQLFAFDGGIFTPLAVPPYGPRDWLDEQISWSR